MDNNNDNNNEKNNINEYEILGKELREKRVEQNKDLKDVADSLKVSEKKLNDIENGIRFNNNSYIRLIIKKYASYLGLDNQEYENKLKDIFPSEVEETIILNDVKDERLKIKKNNNIFKNSKKVISILILLIFIAVLIYLTYYNFNNSVVNGTEPENETTLLNDTVLEPQNVVEKKEPEIIVNVDDNNIELKLESLKDIKVDIEATGVVYIDYSIDGLLTEQRTLNDGESFEIDLDDAKGLLINIGNFSNVKLKVNDVAIDKELSEKLEDVKNQVYIKFEKK